jgi:hypothetical protein
MRARPPPIRNPELDRPSIGMAFSEAFVEAVRVISVMGREGDSLLAEVGRNPKHRHRSESDSKEVREANSKFTDLQGRVLNRSTAAVP